MMGVHALLTRLMGVHAPLTSTIAVKILNGKVKVFALSVPWIQELESGFSYHSACCDEGSTISRNGPDRTGPNSHTIFQNRPDKLDVT